MKNKFVVALTGGFGSGKSTVSKIFAELGVDVIDTDVIARQVVEPGSKALEQIAQHFGAGILTKEHTLNRQKLREIIFSNPEEKRWLENLLHPLIREKMSQQVTTSKSPYCILVIPLLFETNNLEGIDRILVIETPEDIQIQRAMQRDQCTVEQARKIISSQVNNTTRREKADDVIENNSSLEALHQQVEQLHQVYLNQSIE